jgi:hypothetical protein
MTLFAQNLSTQAIWNYADGKKRSYDLHERELAPRGVHIKAQTLDGPGDMPVVSVGSSPGNVLRRTNARRI